MPIPMPIPTLVLLLFAQPPEGRCPASSSAFTGARFDSPFFVFDGGSAGRGFGQFESPGAIAELGGGLLAIADSGNHRIKIVTFEGFFQDFWGEEGDGPGQLRRPGALAATADGRIFVADTGNHRLQLLQARQELVADLTGQHLRTIGRRGRGKGEFESPTGLAFGRDGRLLVVDSGNRRIQVLSPRGRVAAVWRDPAWVEPYAIAVDPASGNIFLSDRGAHRIVALDARGRPLASFAGGADLLSPHGLTVHEGALYVADTGHQRIVKMSLGGELLAAVGCAGSQAGELRDPVAVAVDSEDHLYVVERGNHRVQKLSHQ